MSRWARLVDDPSIRRTAHIFVGSKAPWFAITDDLPQYVGHVVAAENRELRRAGSRGAQAGSGRGGEERFRRLTENVIDRAPNRERAGFTRIRGYPPVWLVTSLTKPGLQFLIDRPVCARVRGSGNAMTNCRDLSRLAPFFLVAAALLLVCQPAFAGKRVALVLGNSAYQERGAAAQPGQRRRDDRGDAEGRRLRRGRLPPRSPGGRDPPRAARFRRPRARCRHRRGLLRRPRHRGGRRAII